MVQRNRWRQIKGNQRQEQIFENNIETEHEKMFSEQGIKIKALIAKNN